MPRHDTGVAEYWHVNIPHNTYTTTRDVTRGDIQKCIGELNESGSDVFAGLHRCVAQWCMCSRRDLVYVQVRAPNNKNML